MLIKSELLRKAQQGDAGSVEEICSITWKPLYRFVFFKVRDREEAEDITQETYVKALSSSRGKDVDSDRYIGFLKTIALNILRDRWRKTKRQGKAVNLDIIDPEKTEAPDQIEERMIRKRLIEALDHLSEEQRTVVILRIIRGYSAQETAKIMKKREGTIRVIQYRALHIMAELLDENRGTGGK